MLPPLLHTKNSLPGSRGEFAEKIWKQGAWVSNWALPHPKGKAFWMKRIAAFCSAFTLFARLQAEMCFLPRTRRGKKRLSKFRCSDSETLRGSLSSLNPNLLLCIHASFQKAFAFFFRQE